MACKIRLADRADAELIQEFILKLARYQKASAFVQVNRETLEEQLSSDKPPFQCFIAEYQNCAVGFALFFESYSTWEGKSGIYLEDLYVEPEARQHGIGRLLLKKLAEHTVSRGYNRLEWSVLSDNQRAIQFYDAIGATAMPEWIRFRLDESSMAALIEADLKIAS